MDLKRGILQELEAIKEGFNDAEEMDGYDLANERFHLENAIALVKKLTIPVVNNNEVACCGNCHLPLDNIEVVPKVQIADKKHNP